MSNIGLSMKSRAQVNRYALVVLLTVVSMIVLVPAYYLIVTTFKSSTEASVSPLGLPTSLDLGIYAQAFAKMQYPRAFMNTFLITAASVIGTIAVSAAAGYAFHRRQINRGFALAFLLLLSGLMFPYQMSIIGLYDVIRFLGLMDTLTAVILINIAVNIPFATFLFYSFMSTVPKELDEAAAIDGAGPFRTFTSIVFPLLRPVVFTVAILNTLSVWNDFMGPLYFLQSRNKQVILQEVYRNVGQFSTDWASLFPMMVLGVLPLLIFFLILQKQIIGGVAGAIKG